MSEIIRTTEFILPKWYTYEFTNKLIIHPAPTCSPMGRFIADGGGAVVNFSTDTD